jgi:predicted site-specific integrase-resolvase
MIEGNLKTLNETAQLFGFRPFTMRREIKEGRGLPHVRKGNRLYFRVEEVEKVLKEQARAAGITAR